MRYNDSVFFSKKLNKILLLTFMIFLFCINLNIVNADAGEMTMTALYAGRGDCILIESKGHYMLVDSGVVENSDELISKLTALNISKIDYIVSTHPDGDHVGGFAKVFSEFEIGETFLSPCPKDLQVYYDFMEALKAEGCPYSNPRNKQVWSVGDAVVTVLYDGAQGSTYNEHSIVLKVTCDGKSIVLTGDLPSTMEKVLLEQGVNFDCDVLKIGHHGATLSSSPAFLDACTPSIAVISSEKFSTVLPKDTVLKRLARRFIKTYRTTDSDVILKFTNGIISTTALENNPFICLKNATVTLDKNVYTATGKAINPGVTVVCNGKVVPATNYTVTYSHNINSGIGTVKIDGNEVVYVSNAYAYFSILPQKEKFTYCDYYRSNGIKVYWKSLPGVTSYQIQYSTDKKFKKKTTTVNIQSPNYTHIFKYLKYNTKYYLRIRAYTKNVGFGKWSKRVSGNTRYVPVLHEMNISKIKLRAIKSTTTSTGKVNTKSNKKLRSVKITWKTDPYSDGYYIQYSKHKTFKKGVKTIKIKDGTLSSTVITLKKTNKFYYFRIKPYKSGTSKVSWGKVRKVHL